MDVSKPPPPTSTCIFLMPRPRSSSTPSGYCRVTAAAYASMMSAATLLGKRMGSHSSSNVYVVLNKRPVRSPLTKLNRLVNTDVAVAPLDDGTNWLAKPCSAVVLYTSYALKVAGKGRPCAFNHCRGGRKPLGTYAWSLTVDARACATFLLVEGRRSAVVGHVGQLAEKDGGASSASAVA